LPWLHIQMFYAAINSEYNRNVELI